MFLVVGRCGAMVYMLLNKLVARLAFFFHLSSCYTINVTSIVTAQLGTYSVQGYYIYVIVPGISHCTVFTGLT